MIDAISKKPIRIYNEARVGPYIMLQVSQLIDVCRLLDKHKIHYSVEDEYISFDGEPEVTEINLDRHVDVEAVQAILDEVH